MDEAERKKLLEAIAARRAKAQGTTVNPRTGVVPSKPTAEPAAPEPSGGMMDSLMSGVRSLFSNEAEQVPSVGDSALENAADPLAVNPITGGRNIMNDPISLLTRAMTAGSGMMDAQAEGDAGQTQYDPSTSATIAAADTASFGTLNNSRAAIDTALETGKPVVQQVIDTAKASIGLGEKDAEWTKSFEENKYMRALEQERIRGDNLLASFGGDLAGSLLPGAGLFKGAMAIGKAVGWEKALTDTWLRRALFTSAVAGGESFGYRVNKDGDLTQAAVDASLAFTGGMVLSGATKGVSGIIGLLRPVKINDAMRESVGAEVIRGINLERQKTGLPPVSPADIQKQVDELGPDATIMDMFPEQMQMMARDLLSKETPEMGAESIRNLMAVRNRAMEDLMQPDGPLRTVLGANPKLLSDAQFRQVTKDSLKALQPQYTQVIAQNSDVTFRAGNMIKSLNVMFGDTPTAAQRDLIAAVTGKVKAVQDEVLKPQKKPLTELPLSALMDMKQELQKSLSGKVLRVNNAGRVLSMDNISTRDLSKVIDYIDDMTGAAVPELSTLNRQYSFTANGLPAYKAGYKMIADGVQADDFAVFMSHEGSRGTGNIPAFIEGAKRGLFNKLEKATTSEQMDKVLLENKNTLNKIRAMFGDEVADQLVSTIKPAVLKIKTAEGLQAATNRVSEQTGNIAKNVADVATIGGGATGLAGTSLAMGAARRLLPKAVANIDPLNPERQKLLSSVLSAKGGDAVQTITQLLNLQKGGAGPDDIRDMAIDLFSTLGVSSGINSYTDSEK